MVKDGNKHFLHTLFYLILHLSQDQGTTGSLNKRWSPRLGMPDLILAGIEPGLGIRSLVFRANRSRRSF